MPTNHIPSLSFLLAVSLLVSITVQYSEHNSRSLFQYYDTDESGAISLRQYRTTVKDSDVSRNINEDDQYYDSMGTLLIDFYDRNGDEQIDWEEWKAFAMDIEDDSIESNRMERERAEREKKRMERIQKEKKDMERMANAQQTHKNSPNNKPNNKPNNQKLQM